MTLTACSEEKQHQVDFSRTEVINRNQSGKSGAVRIAVGGLITPKEGFAYYRGFLDYIGKQLGRPVEYVDATGYEEINKLLEYHEIDGAFVCSGPYVDGHSKFGLELLAAPLVNGAPVYHAYILVPLNSPAKKLVDLKGKSFAFTDPLSNTGKQVPEYLLIKNGENPRTFFSKTVFTGAHDKSIQAVADNLVDGAAVDSLIWEYLHRTKPELTKTTRILLKSEPYAIPPFVVHPSLDPVLKEKLRTILTTAHTTPAGKALLDKMMTDRFVPISDSAYNSIRELKTTLTRLQADK